VAVVVMPSLLGTGSEMRYKRL